MRLVTVLRTNLNNWQCDVIKEFLHYFKITFLMLYLACAPSYELHLSATLIQTVLWKKVMLTKICFSALLYKNTSQCYLWTQTQKLLGKLVQIIHLLCSCWYHWMFCSSASDKEGTRVDRASSRSWKLSSMLWIKWLFIDKLTIYFFLFYRLKKFWQKNLMYKKCDVQSQSVEMSMDNFTTSWNFSELEANHQIQTICLWGTMLTEAIIQLKQSHCL